MFYDPNIARTAPEVDLSKPSVKGLAYLLRHKELWPAGFEFDYSQCSKCAMGLARDVWPREIHGTLPSHVAKAIAIPADVAHTIFARRALFEQGGYVPITPEAIAHDLEALAA